MAAGVLPKPGTELGPCTEDCQHRDCAETRRMAESKCHLCGEPIDYGVRFYADADQLSHARCAEEKAERVHA